MSFTNTLPEDFNEVGAHRGAPTTFLFEAKEGAGAKNTFCGQNNSGGKVIAISIFHLSPLQTKSPHNIHSLLEY